MLDFQCIVKEFSLDNLTCILIAKHFVPNKRLLNKFKSSTENIKEENSVNLSFKQVEDFFHSSHYCYRQH